jgi:uncharacterized protein YlxW (UPF0749 family)
VVVLVCGALFVVSAADSGGTDLRAGRYTDLPSLVEAEADEYAAIEDQRRELTEEVERLSEDVDDSGVSRARGRIEELKDPAGLVSRSGPGVTVVLSDAPEAVFEEARNAGEARQYNLDRYVVHQQDIQAVVNALWLGGAEAVTIAGQRIVSTTGIKCNGPVVRLQGVPYPQPYEIQAVGDPGELLAAVGSDALVAGYRADASNPEIQVGWELSSEDHVEAPAYDGLLDLRYAEPLR